MEGEFVLTGEEGFLLGFLFQSEECARFVRDVGELLLAVVKSGGERCEDLGVQDGGFGGFGRGKDEDDLEHCHLLGCGDVGICGGGIH